MTFHLLCPLSPFLSKYVKLRNGFKKQLHTKPVTERSTLKWLDDGNGWIVVATEKGMVCGASILKKNGEITVFHNGRVVGLGYRLVSHAEDVAKFNGLSFVWAWTDFDNLKSRNLFVRRSFKEGAYFRKEIK